MVLLDKKHCIPGGSGGDLFTALLQGGIDEALESDPEAAQASTTLHVRGDACDSESLQSSTTLDSGGEATHLLTYATHDAGMFQKLVNNDHDADVTVLGWDQPWNDYRDRWRAYRDEILRRGRLEDVFILADGFDVQILQPIEKARKAFDLLGARLVVSEATWQNFAARRMYLATSRAELPFSFGRSENSLIGCAGLVMGHGREIVRLATIISKSHCTDDQRTLNTMLPSLEGAVIDKDRKIFCTLKSHIMRVPPDVMFVHYPGALGQLNLGRAFRSIQEYLQFFIGDVAMLFLLATFILLIFQQMEQTTSSSASMVPAGAFSGHGSLMATYVSGCGCFIVFFYVLLCNKT